MWVMPLSEVEMTALPYPETARKIGGLLVLEEDKTPLEYELERIEIEKLRELWDQQVLRKD